MVIAGLLEELTQLRQPDRRIDLAIALLVDHRGSENGTSASRVVPFDREKANEVPYYTSRIDHARALADFVAPDTRSGCSWEDGMGSARVGNGSTCQAANSAIALCIAALSLKVRPTAI
jgi:hypothetical protein